jgi:CheY-like chemotaxis protein
LLQILGDQYTSALRILIVDDNAINRTVLQRILSHLGYVADLATNGREALDDLKKQHYDVIFMDLQMPILDGLRTTRIIRENCAREDQPYIIAITAYEDKYSWEMCEKAGMDDFIAKPASFDNISNAIEAFKKRLMKLG